MSVNEESELRGAIERLSKDRMRRRYDDELKRRVVRFARARIRAGATASSVAQALDMGPPTLMRFLEQVPELVPVAIVDAPAATDAGEPDGSGERRTSEGAKFVVRGLTVHGPRGLRVEGLTIEEVASLFERMAACSG